MYIPINNNLERNAAIMVRHYDYLLKESLKKNPSYKVTNVYLNKEYGNRRKWILGLDATTRCAETIDKYPCFKNHVHVSSVFKNIQIFTLI